MLKHQPIAADPDNGSDFTTLKMMEGFLARGARQEDQRQGHRRSKRLEAVSRRAKVAAATLMEPWISVAQKWVSHPDRVPFHAQRGGGDDLDGPTSRRCSAHRRERQGDLKRTPPLTSTISSARPAAGSNHTSSDLAPASRRAATLHARALRGHLQLDRQVEHDGAGATYGTRWTTAPGSSREQASSTQGGDHNGTPVCRRRGDAGDRVECFRLLIYAVVRRGLDHAHRWVGRLDNSTAVATPTGERRGGAVVADKGKGGHLVSKNSYKDFEIRAEFWADHTTNSGVFIRITIQQDHRHRRLRGEYLDQRPN